MEWLSQTRYALDRIQLRTQIEAEIDEMLADINAKYKLLLDEVGDTMYVGEAIPGSLEAGAVWRIKRLDSSGGIETRVFWADGDTNFDNIWNDRLTLSYS